MPPSLAQASAASLKSKRTRLRADRTPVVNPCNQNSGLLLPTAPGWQRRKHQDARQVVRRGVDNPVATKRRSPRTAEDLYSYSQTQNDQPPPRGPSPGGRSAAGEMCWDHGGDAAAQRQAVRTGLGLLLLSVGTPMVSGGSEMYRTQFGKQQRLQPRHERELAGLGSHARAACASELRDGAHVVPAQLRMPAPRRVLHG